MGRKSAKKQEQYLIQMRRKSVAEMWFSGESIEKMVETWKCDKSTIYRDMEYIEEHADEMLQNYIVRTVPHIINRSLYQLDIANRESMKILKTATSNREKIAAAMAVSKTAMDVVDVVTNNDGVVNMALELDKTVQRRAEEYLYNQYDKFSEEGTEGKAEASDSNRKF